MPGGLGAAAGLFGLRLDFLPRRKKPASQRDYALGAVKTADDRNTGGRYLTDLHIPPFGNILGVGDVNETAFIIMLNRGFRQYRRLGSAAYDPCGGKAARADIPVIGQHNARHAKACLGVNNGRDLPYMASVDLLAADRGNIHPIPYR